MPMFDPDHADSLNEERGKSKLNNTAASIDTPSTPGLNSTGANQCSLDHVAGESSSGARMGSATTPNINSENHSTVSTPAQQKDIPATPTTRITRTTKSSSRKQPTHSKRKKRKIISSDDDENECFYNNENIFYLRQNIQVIYYR